MNILACPTSTNNSAEQLIRNILARINSSDISAIMEPMRNYPPNIWHRWDAHEHSNQVCLSVQNFVTQQSSDFPGANIARSLLMQRIDGIEKWRLMSLAGLLHDVGKGYLQDPANATGHTKLSLLVLDQNKSKLKLSEKQFEFLRTIIENHHKFDKIAVSESYEFTRRFLPDSKYICESVLFSLFDIEKCQGPAYTDRSCEFYPHAQENIVNRRRLTSALLQENFAAPDLGQLSFSMHGLK